ncbi:MAG: glutamate-5-semialdehyde dehydrogenase [Actinobacteria bacterium]|nr:glutamate-5-semialdehyde dehydrogenase [Actinomycetota bacterium]
MTANSLIEKAKLASGDINRAGTSLKNQALERLAALLEANAAEILAANEQDLEHGAANGLAIGLQDRLRLTTERIASLASAVREIIALADPVGEIVSGRTLHNGLKISQVRVPFGVIGMIYEARPNVTIDIAALAIKSGNALVLRGGSAAEKTNAVLIRLVRRALDDFGISPDVIQSVDEFGRDGAKAIMMARGLVDVLIPRGSANLIKTVVEESKVPVIETGDGIVHIYVDESADLDKAIPIIINSKTQRPSVCNSLETLLVHKDVASELLPKLNEALLSEDVVVHADETASGLMSGATMAQESDWATEYLALELSVRVVDGIDQALDHIARYSTKHTESILTEDLGTAERFLAEVDAAVVMVNSSTRFTDGGEFGFGAEVGISTQKLHARGPMGLSVLTSTKWLVRGNGQVRG